VILSDCCGKSCKTSLVSCVNLCLPHPFPNPPIYPSYSPSESSPRASMADACWTPWPHTHNPRSPQQTYPQPYLTSSTSPQLSKQTHHPNPISLKLNHLSHPHKPEHFALFASFAVYDFGHRKECGVRKDSLNCLVFDYNPIKLKIIPS